MWPALPASVGLLLAACTVGPDFVRPEASAQAGYVHGEAPEETAASEGIDGRAQVFHRAEKVRADWYRLFHADALNQLITTALTNNPGLQAARERVQAARDNLRAVRGDLYPQLDASAGISRNRRSGTEFGISGPLFTNVFNLYEGQLSLDYNLDVFGGLRRRIENRRARLDARRYRLLNAYLTLIDNVVATSLAVAGVNATLSATQRIVASEQDALELLKGQARYGAADRSDVLRAKAQLAASRATVPPLQKQRFIARHRLAVLTGESPAAFAAPAIKLADFDLPRRLPVTVPSTLVRQRPDIRAAQSMMHAASARVGVATARLLPRFSISASYGRNALTPGGLADPVAAVWDFGANLMAPVFQGGKLRAQRRAARDLYRAAAADYQSTVLTAFGEVADSLRGLAGDARALKAQHKSLQAARASLGLVRKQVKQGAADDLDLFTAQQQRDRALIDYTQARLQRYQDTAMLFRALGGGWWQAKIGGATLKTTSGSSGP